jgi:hypothetical protein
MKSIIKVHGREKKLGYTALAHAAFPVRYELNFLRYVEESFEKVNIGVVIINVKIARQRKH